VFPKIAIQASDGGARAGLYGATERVKHSAIAATHLYPGKAPPASTSAATVPTGESTPSGANVRNDSGAKPTSSGISSSVTSLPPVTSPDPQHTYVPGKPPPPEIQALLERGLASSFDDNDDDSYVLSDSDEESRSPSPQHRIKSGAAGVAVSVVTATVTSTCDVSSDSSFEKSELEDSVVKDGNEDVKRGVSGSGSGVTGDGGGKKGVSSDVMVEFNDEDMLDEDDGSSINSETGEGKSPLDMRETSRIEDSLDESINTYDEEHKLLVSSSSQSDLLIPPARTSRKVVKIANTSKYELHKSSDKRLNESGDNVSTKHPDDDKPLVKPPVAAAIFVPGPKLQVDSLGNIISNRHKPVVVNSALTAPPPVAEAMVKGPETQSSSDADEENGRSSVVQEVGPGGSQMKGPAATILSSGSLLGNRGRNKAPLQR
jgi:hypothetical protein